VLEKSLKRLQSARGSAEGHDQKLIALRLHRRPLQNDSVRVSVAAILLFGGCALNELR
jgi:hypothetical protein